MRRVLATAVGLLSLGVLAVCVAGAAAKGVTPCSDADPPLAGTIDGDVSAGPGCDLSNVTLVKGNVKVERGGSLTATIAPGSSLTITGDVQVNPGGSLTVNVGPSGDDTPGGSLTIAGDVKSKDATSIDIEGSVGGNLLVGGSVRIEGTAEGTTLASGTVNRDVEIKKSLANIQVLSESVGGDVRVHDNTGSDTDGSGSIQMAGNNVSGTVDVAKNSLTGSQFNLVLISNPVDPFFDLRGINRDLHVHDNSLSGDGGNALQIVSNGVVRGGLDVHGNSVTGGGTNLVDTSSNEINRDLDVHGNTASGGSGGNEVLTYSNRVEDGNLGVHDNRADVVGVSDNTVEKELDCHGNRPRATENPGNGPNQAAKKKGECKDL